MDILKLKNEQEELKNRLLELTSLINSEEYYKLTERERGLITKQRTGMELYLSSITQRLYGDVHIVGDNSLVWMSLLYGFMNTPSFSSSSPTDYLGDKLYQVNQEEDKKNRQDESR